MTTDPLSTTVPGLTKTGAKYGPICEATPVVWRDRLLLLVNIRPISFEDREQHYLELWDITDGERKVLSQFGRRHSLASAFVWEGTLYVYGACIGEKSWNHVNEMRSTDLVTWTEPRIVVEQTADENLFNQSVCWDGRRFVMAYESNDPAWPAFTNKFAESDDLVTWRKIDGVVYDTDRYTACPCLRFVDGWYYMMYLEHKTPDWWFETHLVRSRDLRSWEPSPRNPILAPAADGSECINTSDPDIVEWQGRTLLYYSYGDQRTWTELTRAEYAGTLADFYRACY